MRQEIEIEGLPEGWRVKGSIRIPVNTIEQMDKVEILQTNVMLTLEKIKPRRIVLEETEEVADTTQFMNTGDVQLHIQGNSIITHLPRLLSRFCFLEYATEHHPCS